MQCKAQTLFYCVQTGDTVNISVNDIFQQTNGTPTFTRVGNALFGSPAPNTNFTIQGSTSNITASNVSFTVATPVSASGSSFLLTFCGIDNDNVELCCQVALRLDSDCQGTGNNGSGNCTGAGPYFVNVGSQIDIPVSDIHSSGVAPNFISESVSNVTSLIGLGPPQITIQGNATGTNFLTLEFNGEQCVIEVQVGNGGGGGNPNTGSCVSGYTPPNIPLGSFITIQHSEVHGSGIQPTNVLSQSNNNINLDFLTPIVVSGLAIGQTTVVFDFNGDQCPVTFNVVDAGTGGGGTCPVECAQVSMSLGQSTPISNASFNVSGCGATYSYSIFIPNLTGVDLSNVSLDISPTVDNIPPVVTTQFDSTQSVTIVSGVISTRDSGCSSTSVISLQGLEALGCSDCVVGTLSVASCDDCGTDPSTGPCTTTATLSETNLASVSPSGTVVLGPAEGCNCLGCEIKWLNSPDNPIQIDIPDPYQSTLLLTIPVFAPEGTYEFFPACCNCD